MDIRTIVSQFEKRDLEQYENLKNYFDSIQTLSKHGYHSEALVKIKKVRKISNSRTSELVRSDINLALDFQELYKKSLLFASVDDLDSYLLYMEFDREPEKRFYLPRRRVLKAIVKDLQDLHDGALEFLAISLPPRVGKSTLGIFYMTWLMGKYPDKANLMSGHSGKLTEGFYRETLNIITDPEYNWSNVFPKNRIANTSAKNESIDINSVRRFPTVTCRSIGGTLTGAVEVGMLLYVDDIIEDLEEALNPERLQNKYNAYLNQLKDRKKKFAKELHIGTRWSVADVIGKIQEQYADNPRYRFRIIPALDEQGESNFDYDYDLGFDTAYYEDMRNSIDKAEWEAKYMGSPYVREGLLFPEDELVYYNGTLPDGEPDRKIAVCDVAWGGGDNLSMPIAYIYGNDVYIVDVVYNKGDKNVTRPLVVGKLSRHLPHQVRFEADNGGHEYADIVDRRLRKLGIRTNITSAKAPNRQSKMSRIIQASPDIKRLYFLERKARSEEYRNFMQDLTRFMMTGKNKNDDAPDSLAMITSLLGGSLAKVSVSERWF